MRVLVFGDSNSWGILADGTGLRHPQRWPVVMAQHIGADLIEDCIPGRTTAHDDFEMSQDTAAPAHSFNGLTHLPGALLAASPIDLVLIMLGTNDLKARFAPSAGKIAKNIANLVDIVAQSTAGPGAWADGSPPKVGVICPAAIGPTAEDPSWERHQEWAGAREISIALPDALRTLIRVPILCAGDLISASQRDPIHFEPEMHPILGEAAANWVKATC